MVLAVKGLGNCHNGNLLVLQMYMYE